jgi:hypothetical protein
MKTVLRSAVVVCALAAGVVLVTGGPAGAAGAVRAGSAAPASARSAQGASLGNYRISGVEDAIGCLTAHRCVAVGHGGGQAPGQVVEVVGGKQVRVSVARPASNLVAVSCPNRYGCWAMGPPRKGERSWVLVKIGSTGSITEVTSVRVPRGVSLGSISCTSRSSCELFGITTIAAGINQGFNEWYLALWNGKKLTHRYVAGCADCDYADALGGSSCWQATCVAVGQWLCPGSACAENFAILTTLHGKLETAAMLNTPGELGGVSCVSSSTCYATADDTVVTLTNGVPGEGQSLPVYEATIECADSTCWAAGQSNVAPNPIVFVTIANGVPAGSPVADTAITGLPAIARRGNGFAAVGPAASGGPNVSEVVTN